MPKQYPKQANTYNINSDSFTNRPIKQWIYSPQNYDEKLNSASKFQAILSGNLARKFISCWKSLKNFIVDKRQNMQNNSINEYRFQRVQGLNQQKIKHNAQYYEPEMGNNKLRIAQIQSILRTVDQQKPLIRTRSEDLKPQVSKAQILYQIAEKLKKSKKSREQTVENQSLVSKKLSRLQNKIKHLKNTQKKSNIQFVTSHCQTHENQAKSKTEISKMLNDISQLKRQIQLMKNSNQSILRHQLQESKVQQHLLYLRNQSKKLLESSQPTKLFSNYTFTENTRNNIYKHSHLPSFNPTFNSINQSKQIMPIPHPTVMNFNHNHSIDRNRSNSINVRINGISQPVFVNRTYQGSQGIAYGNIGQSNRISTTKIQINHCNFCGRSCNCLPTKQPLIKYNQ